MAAAQVVEADHEKAIGIDGFARPYALFPPAGSFVVFVVVASGMMVAAEGVTDQYGVAARRIELAVGFVDQLIVGQLPATGQRQWLV